ncbi:MAG: DHH family phosphoesterase [Candidatus Kerfeldbacteria bacterium]
MELSPLQQAVELASRSKNVLICLPVNPTSDAIAGGLGLFLSFEKLQKRARIVCSKFELPLGHGFLPKSNAIEKELSNIRQFVIGVDTSRTSIEDLSYAIEGKKLNIYLTPKDGFFEARDVTTSAGDYAYDLIVVLDATDLDSLGDLATRNAEFFYKTPVLNIDHRASNTHFGSVNLVDLPATSTSEIIFELVKALGFNVLDEQVATTLLTGIISKTKSFQTPTVTPRSLAIASHLIASGARREEIIDNLYQSKPISTLKLWGRALARVQQKHDGRMIYTLLSEQDFEKSAATEDDLPRVIDELIVNVPTAEIIAILCLRTGKNVTALVSTTRPYDLKKAFPEGKIMGSASLILFNTPFPDLTSAENDIVSRAGRLLE